MASVYLSGGPVMAQMTVGMDLTKIKPYAVSKTKFIRIQYPECMSHFEIAYLYHSQNLRYGRMWLPGYSDATSYTAFGPRFKLV